MTARVRPLPYKVLAGVTPCPGGWLVLPARLAGVTVIVEEAMVMRTLLEVLDYKPRFEAAAINIATSFNDIPDGPYRACDVEARELLGWPRRASIAPVPSRAALQASSPAAAKEVEPWLTDADLRRFRWLREAEEQFQPFHQRTWFAAHPELSFAVLNSDEPLTSSPYQEDGVLERINLLRLRLPGSDTVILGQPPAGAAQVHLMQAGALLWTARRAIGHAVNRLPIDPVWDPTGLRMELVR